MSGDSLFAEDSAKTDLCNTQLRAVHALTNRESSTVTSFGKPLSRIRFYAQVPRFVHVGRYDFPIERCEFTLGLGPCGRTVTRLGYHLDTAFLTILQECAAPDEGEIDVKKFIYLVSEITGRVEVTSV